jgi:hypothetical protein
MSSVSSSAAESSASCSVVAESFSEVDASGKAGIDGVGNTWRRFEKAGQKLE